jgi:hypothetical protein
MKFINDEPTGSARGMTMTPTRETIQRRFSLVQGLRVAHACFLQTRDRKKGKSKPIFKLGLPTVARVITYVEQPYACFMYDEFSSNTAQEYINPLGIKHDD